MFLTFHGPERFRHAPAGHDGHGAEEERGVTHAEPDAAHGHGEPPHESPWVVTLPLIALAIPSVVIGALTVGPVLFGGYFGRSIFTLPANDVVGELAHEFPGAVRFGFEGLASLPFALALAGVATAWVCFLWRPALADAAARRFAFLRRLLTHKYYFDWFNEHVIAPLARGIGVGLWKGGDQGLIDGALVNGTAAGVSWFGSIARRVQSGYLYSYAFWMMIGLALLLGWFLAH